jgi:hypothetical protein
VRQIGRLNDAEHPQTVIDRLKANLPSPPVLDPRSRVSPHHARIAALHHNRRLADHLLRMEAWKRTLADEQTRLASLKSGGKS